MEEINKRMIKFMKNLSGKFQNTKFFYSGSNTQVILYN
jgi:hypothetical protein